MAADKRSVLVVGAGPSGLMMAIELARRGIAVRIVEKLPQRSPYSRALVVHARSLELFHNLGIDRGFLAAGFRTIGVAVYVKDRPAFDVTFADIGISGTPFPYVLFISQADTERLLEEALIEHGARVERGVSLSRFQRGDDGVDALLTHADGATEKFRCAYLVGCDGAHSTVRHGLGLAFDGAPYEQTFVLADARIEWTLPRDRLVLMLGAPGVVAAFPFPDGTHRLIVTAPESTGETDHALTTSDVERLVREVGNVDIRISAPVWLSRFRLHHRIAQCYGVGRAFLVGDAAHIHSPAGGQGMNTGIQDAANLAWKLALVMNGQATPELLESYNIERRPIGKTLLERTDRLFEVAATGNRRVVALRNFLVPRLGPLMLRYRRLRQRLFKFVSQLGIRYGGSPIAIDTRRWRSGLRAGDRAPDIELRRAGTLTSLFDAMRGPEHRLIVFNDNVPHRSAELVQCLPFPCRVIDIDRDDTGAFVDPAGKARMLYGAGSRSTVFLVRPDGYIGVRATLANAESALRRYIAALSTASQ